MTITGPSSHLSSATLDAWDCNRDSTRNALGVPKEWGLATKVVGNKIFDTLTPLGYTVAYDPAQNQVIIKHPEPKEIRDYWEALYHRDLRALYAYSYWYPNISPHPSNEGEYCINFSSKEQMWDPIT